MKASKLLAILLALILVICLLPAAALADPEDAGDKPETGETQPETGSPEAGEAAPAPESAGDKEEPAEEAEEDEDAPVFNEADETYYSLPGETVYNNGGTVYNNGALVYNNGGLVYHNGGTVYNNGGTVYANGGTVYNNGGQVYRNDALVYTFADDVSDSHVYGYYRVETAADYSAFADLEGLNDGYLYQDAVCAILPHEGWLLTEAKADSGTLTRNEDGSWTLSEARADLVLTLTFQAEEPVFELEQGTYTEEQLVAISAPEGAQILYTLDGSKPQEGSALVYEGAIELSEGVKITAVAVAEGAEPSKPVTAAYAVIRLTAPEFEDGEEGKDPPKAGAFTLENLGQVDAKILGVKLEGENAACFTLSSENGATLKAGRSNNSTWTIRPVKGLAKGEYSVTAVFSLEGGATAEATVTFRVK